ncbi:MAG: DUF393 domain-containing protein [bacterium]|nr:DUF393 domain-containing protein [bacterium]
MFLVHRDRMGRLSFSPIQSARYQHFAREHGITLTPRSVLVWDEARNLLLSEADAILFLLTQCVGPWRQLALLLTRLPRGPFKLGYRLIARWRHRWFRPPQDLIPVLPPDLAPRVQL